MSVQNKPQPFSREMDISFSISFVDLPKRKYSRREVESSLSISLSLSLSLALSMIRRVLHCLGIIKLVVSNTLFHEGERALVPAPIWNNQYRLQFVPWELTRKHNSPSSFVFCPFYTQNNYTLKFLVPTISKSPLHASLFLSTLTDPILPFPGPPGARVQRSPVHQHRNPDRPCRRGAG